MSLNTYIRAGPYKGQQVFIVSKKPIHDNPYLYRVSLPSHKLILIDQAYLSSRKRYAVTLPSPPPTELKYEPTPIAEAPTTFGCCAVSLCQKCGPMTPNTEDKCCCPSFVKCRVHGKYTFKNPKPKSSSKIIPLPIGDPSLFRSTIMSYDKKKKRRVKRVVQAEEKYDFEDNDAPFFDDHEEDDYSDYEEPKESDEEKYTRLVLETVAPEVLMAPIKTYKKKQGRYRGGRVSGTLSPEEDFPVGFATSERLARFGGESEEYLRNLSIYERIVESRKVV